MLPSVPAFRLYSRAELDDLPSPTWLIDKILPDKALIFLYGEPGTGKTFVALDMALSIATGRHWQSRACRRGPVVYSLAEGGLGLRKRILAYEAHHNAQIPLGFYAITGQPQLDDRSHVDGLIASISELTVEPIAIFIDTLARHASNSDENNQQDMNRLIQAADALRLKFGCSVVIVHHTRKTQGDSRRPVERGSSVLRGAADTMIALTKGRGLTLSCEKQKDDEPFAAVPLKLLRVTVGNEDMQHTSCVVVPDTAPTQSVLLDTQRRLLSAFAMEPDSIHTSSDLRTRSGLTNATYHRAQKKLLTLDLIEKVDNEYRLTGKGKETLRAQ